MKSLESVCVCHFVIRSVITHSYIQIKRIENRFIFSLCLCGKAGKPAAQHKAHLLGFGVGDFDSWPKLLLSLKC